MMLKNFLKRLKYRRSSGYQYRIKSAGNQTTFVGYLEQSVFGKNNLGKYRVMGQRKRKRILIWTLLAITLFLIIWAIDSL